MKTFMKTTVMATSLVMALTACGGKKTTAAAKGKDDTKNVSVTVPDKTSPEQQVQVSVDAKPVADAAGLADAGEQLVGPYTFMLADKVFDSALQADPNNKKAQFYKVFIKRMMVFKGIAKRVRPLIASEGNIAELDKQTQQFPESPLKQFLLDGKEDIKTASQVLDVIDNYKSAVNDFRKFAKTNATLELTLNLNPYLFEKEITQQASENCTASENPDHSVTVTCDYSQAAVKKINSADMVGLAQASGGELLYWALYTSYDPSTLIEISKSKALENMKTKQEALDALKAYPSVAKLRKGVNLTMIPDLGADMGAAVKWAITYQKQICPYGANGGRYNRRGFVFSNGFCIDSVSEAQKALAMLDQALSGPIMVDQTDASGTVTGQVKVDPVRFLKNAPADLKTLLPKTLDEQSNATFTDKTFNGLLPNGNADDLIGKNRN